MPKIEGQISMEEMLAKDTVEISSHEKNEEKIILHEDTIARDGIQKFLTSVNLETFEKVMGLTETIKNRVIFLGDIEEETGSSVEQIIRFFNTYDDEQGYEGEDRKPIKLLINSGGGLITETFTMIDAIERSETPVDTYNLGCAYSGGFFVFIAGRKRYASKRSSFLFHEGSGGFSGDAGKFQNFADYYKKQRDTLKDLCMTYTKITPEEYAKHQNEDWWFDAKEALELGIADEIY